MGLCFYNAVSYDCRMERGSQRLHLTTTPCLAAKWSSEIEGNKHYGHYIKDMSCFKLALFIKATFLCKFSFGAVSTITNDGNGANAQSSSRSIICCSQVLINLEQVCVWIIFVFIFDLEKLSTLQK